MRYKSAIIHLSDTQFGPKNRAKQADILEIVGEPYVESINNLAEDIETEVIEKHRVKGQKIGLIISGDVTETGSEDQFLCAKEAFNLLLGRLKVPANQLAIVPGNHDVSWDDCKKAYRTKIRDKAENKKKIREVMRSSPEKLARFAKFFRDLCVTRFEIEKPSVFKGFVNLGIALVGFDSTYPCRWGKKDNYGVLRWEQVKAAGDELKHLLTDNDALIPIAAVHHSLLPKARGNSKDISYLRQARKVRMWLRKQGFGTVLCGHEHTPSRSSDIHGNFKVLVTGCFGLSLKELMEGKEKWQRAETNKYEIILINPEGRSKILYRRLNTSDYGADAPMGKWEEDLSDGTPSDEVVLWRPQMEGTGTESIAELPEVELVIREPVELPPVNTGKSWLVAMSIQPKRGTLNDIKSVIYRVEPGGNEITGDPKCGFLGDVCLDRLEGLSVEAVIRHKTGKSWRLVSNIPIP